MQTNIPPTAVADVMSYLSTAPSLSLSTCWYTTDYTSQVLLPAMPERLARNDLSRTCTTTATK
jgi:hypothetical protein